MGRAPCCDKANVKRGPWSPDEDAILRTYLQTYGTGGNWIALPRKAGLRRCGKSCRLRWLNYLRPDIKHGGFTEEEDRIICSLYSRIGSRWSIIASKLPGRTDNDVKNYWNTKLKKKLMAAQATLQPTTPSPQLPPQPPLTTTAMTPEQLLHQLSYPPSVASSTLTATDSNGSSGTSYINYWPTMSGVAGDDADLFSELSFCSHGDFFGSSGIGYGLQDSMEELPPLCFPIPSLKQL